MGIGIGGTGYNKGCASFVDEHTVHFINYGIVMSSLNHPLFAVGHVVSEIIKSKLVVGSIGYVSFISSDALFMRHVMIKVGNGKAEYFIYWTHPVCISLGQIIINRY